MSDAEGEAWVQAPIRVYRGYVTPDGPVVVADDGGGPRFLQPDPTIGFAWGKNGLVPAYGGRQLAMAILSDATGDEQEAARLATRFQHRVVVPWTAGEPWQITVRQVLAHVEEMCKIEIETAGERAAVARQLPQVEGGGLPFAVEITPGVDQGVDRHLYEKPRPVDPNVRASALAKLSDEERKALGL